MIKQLKNMLEKSEDQFLEFDARYNTRTKQKIKNRKKNTGLFETWLKQNEKIIEHLKEKNPAQAMDYFYELFTTDKRIKELRELKDNGVKIIGTFCNLVPEELVYAAGAIPVRLCSGCLSMFRPWSHKNQNLR